MRPNPEHQTQPFIHHLNILADEGDTIKIRANFDDGALANAMSISTFNKVKQWLGRYIPSSRWLRMADGTLIEPMAVWEGRIEIAGVIVHRAFEVFDSGGNWDFLFRKPLLKAFKAVHNYTSDTVTI